MEVVGGVSAVIQIVDFTFKLCERARQAYEAVQSNVEEAQELRERISNVQAVLEPLGPALQASRDERQADASTAHQRMHGVP